MMEKLNSLDVQAFYWINGHHCTTLDYILWTFSQGWSWAIVLVVILVFVTAKREPKTMLFVLFGIALCFLLGDRISPLVLKH